MERRTLILHFTNFKCTTSYYQLVLFNVELITCNYKQFTIIIHSGRIHLCIGADITWCSKGFPFNDNDTRMSPATHFLVSHLNIKYF